MMRMCLHKSMGKVMAILTKLTFSFDNMFSTKAGKTNLELVKVPMTQTIIRITRTKTKKLIMKMKIETRKWTFLNKSITSVLKRKIVLT
jgi:6-phosphofructokinase